MTIFARVIADSISPTWARISTVEATYPRVIHSELMTHRLFSRNASSSRAIPWERMKQWVLEEPYIPIHWGKNQRGMQATRELTVEEIELARHRWLSARDFAVTGAQRLADAGVHKQLVNRLIEPFAHINVVLTATWGNAGWQNFFALRIHQAAMPEIQALAVAIARALRDSEPTLLMPGMWHVPYVDDTERPGLDDETLVMMSTARCARVSYRTFEGKVPELAEDINLYHRLVAEDPKHASPSEHPAMSLSNPTVRSGNFMGWRQHRKDITGECAPTDFDWQARLVEYEGRDYIV